MQRRKAVLKNLQNLIIEVEALPNSPPNGTVRVQVVQCGICGSDIATYVGRHPRLKPPVVMGHEMWGRVVVPGTSALLPGQSVTMYPVVSCRDCEFCDAEREYLCTKMRVIGGVIEGALAELIDLPVRNVIPIPNEVPECLRVLIEPLAVAVHATKQGGCLKGSTCLILGGGIIGTLVALLLQKLGAHSVMVAETQADRRELLAKLGIPVRGAMEEMSSSGRDDTDVAFECVGMPDTAARAIQAVRPRGRAVLVGNQNVAIMVNGEDIQRGEKSVMGSMMYARQDIHDAIDWLGQEILPMSWVPELLQHFPLDEADRAFRVGAKRKVAGLKAVIDLTPG